VLFAVFHADDNHDCDDCGNDVHTVDVEAYSLDHGLLPVFC
jgi:hypothetical protein